MDANEQRASPRARCSLFWLRPFSHPHARLYTMQGWHRSAEARRPRRSSSPASPSSRSGTSTPPLLDPLASPLALGLELDSKISALEEQHSPRKATSHLSPSKIPHTTPATLSECVRRLAAFLPAVRADLVPLRRPLSHLSKALVTLSNAKRTPELMSGDTAVQQVRFALEGVLDLAISMSGTSLTVEDVLEACLEKQQQPATPSAPAPSNFTSAEPSPSSEPTPTTADRLHALEKSNTASQAAILERLTRVEKQLKKQGRRSAMGSPAPSVAESTCDCEGRKSELEKREEAMEVQSKAREASMVSYCRGR